MYFPVNVVENISEQLFIVHLWTLQAVFTFTFNGKSGLNDSGASNNKKTSLLSMFPIFALLVCLMRVDASITSAFISRYIG